MSVQEINKEMRSEEWIRYISDHALSKEELAWLYCWGFEWMGWLVDPENLPAVTKVMLDKGMDPNQLVPEEPSYKDPKDVFYMVPLITATRINGNDSAASESLKLLLEHGGNPNTVYSFEDSEYQENVFEFYVEDEFANAPDLDGGTFYGLLLCAAYGGKNTNGYMPFTMLIDAPISIFKDYSRYWYEYGEDEKRTDVLYVIDRETGQRVARYF